MDMNSNLESPGTYTNEKFLAFEATPNAILFRLTTSALLDDQITAEEISRNTVEQEEKCREFLKIFCRYEYKSQPRFISCLLTP